MNLNHDPELPAGLQDADLDLANLQRAAARDSAARRAGHCPHTWLSGPPGPPNAPRTNWLCRHCGQTFTQDPWNR